MHVSIALNDYILRPPKVLSFGGRRFKKLAYSISSGIKRFPAFLLEICRA
jgi:hypothetical protein